jgi:hypothetical protein
MGVLELDGGCKLLLGLGLKGGANLKANPMPTDPFSCKTFNLLSLCHSVAMATLKNSVSSLSSRPLTLLFNAFRPCWTPDSLCRPMSTCKYCFNGPNF